MLRKGKKAQEEMMGFVLIVLVVIIIGVVFFAFSIRRTEDGALEHKSGEMSHMLDAMLKCKTICNVSRMPQPLDKVVRMCLTDEQCENGDDPCEIANDTFTEMLDEFLGTETSIVKRAIHGYNLSFSQGGIPISKMASLKAGTTERSFFSVSEIVPNPPNPPIEVKLRCYHVSITEAEEED